MSSESDVVRLGCCSFFLVNLGARDIWKCAFPDFRPKKSKMNCLKFSTFFHSCHIISTSDWLLSITKFELLFTDYIFKSLSISLIFSQHYFSLSSQQSTIVCSLTTIESVFKNAQWQLVQIPSKQPSEGLDQRSPLEITHKMCKNIV